MINKNNKYKLFQSDNVWILTKDKISSSWLKTEFDYVYINIDFDTETFNVSFDSFDLQSNYNSFLSEKDYNQIKNDFINDWNSVTKGINTSRDFLFLIRNPIHKFISGWIQDNIMRKTNDGYIDDENQRLKKYFSPQLVDEFFYYIKNLPQVNFALHIFPDTDTLPIKFKHIYEEFILPKEHIFFKQDNHILFQSMLDGHIEQDLFMLWKILFKESIYNSKIKILDIDMQDLEIVLSKKYNISLNQNNTYKHTRGKYIRNKTYEYLSQHHVIINNIFNLQLFFWFEIISKIYPEELYKQSILIDGIKPISSFKNRYFIPEYSDFHNIHTHFNWFQYKPESISLNYEDGN